jgi:hypothetical protein
MATKISLDDAKLQAIKAAVADQTVKSRIIHDGVEYGIFVELGTSRMAARPNLVPAFEQVTKGLDEAIGQAIERAINVDDVMAKMAFDIQAIWASGVPVNTGAFRNSITVSEQ